MNSIGNNNWKESVAGPLISHDELEAAGTLELPPKTKKKGAGKQKVSGPSLFEAEAKK